MAMWTANDEILLNHYGRGLCGRELSVFPLVRRKRRSRSLVQAAMEMSELGTRHLRPLALKVF